MNLYSYANNQKYLHYDNWITYRNSLPPRNTGNFRVDLELCNPSHFLWDIKINRNPHNLKPNGHICYYSCDEWTTVYDIHEVTHPQGGPSYRFLAESNHKEPCFGERVILYSTSSSIWNEPWGTNKSNVFAFFRNQYWLVSNIDFMENWKFWINYPLIEKYYVRNYEFSLHNVHNKEDFPQPSYIEEKEDFVKPFLINIIENIKNKDYYAIFADYLQDKGVQFGEYVAKSLDLIDLRQEAIVMKRFLANRKFNTRTAIFFLANCIQMHYNPLVIQKS